LIHRDQPNMYRVGIVKPVKITIARIRIAAGAMAPGRVRDVDATKRNTIDMTMVVEKATNTKKKNAPGSRRRLVIKYNVKLKKSALRILYGMSVNILAKASALG